MLAVTPEEIDQVVNAVDSSVGVVFDTETSSLFPMRDGDILAGLAVRPLGYPGNPSWYIPVGHEDCVAPQASRTDLARVLAAMRGKTLFGHNAPFDIEVLYQFGYDLTVERLVDTMVMARLCYEDLPSYRLKDLGVRFIDPGAANNEKELKAFMRKYKMKRYSQVPPQVMEPYAVQDVVLTDGLLRVFKPIIDSRGLQDLLRLESRVTNTLIKMEVEGVKIDQEYVREAIDDITKANKVLMTEIYRLAGREFNMNSGKQLGEVFNSWGVHSAKKTDKGAESWDIIALALIDHPMARYVKLHRTYEKLRDTYLRNFIDLSDDDMFLHCKFRQSGTKTGRMSCTSPNLQNIPRFEGFSNSKVGAIAASITSQLDSGIEYTETGKHGSITITKEGYAEQQRKLKELIASQKREIKHVQDEEEEEVVDYESGAALSKVRGAFIPSDSESDLFFIDFQQMEMRVFADYTDENALLKAFDFGLDIHDVTAKTAFGTDVPDDHNSQEYKWYRNMGKQIAFGLIYGMGIKLLAIEIRRPQEDAKRFMATYFERFGRAKQFIDETTQLILDQGFVANKFGRRRYLEPQRAYVGVNFLIQGTCADMVKMVMNRIDEMQRERGFKSRMLLQVHDELIFNVLRSEVDEYIPEAVRIMTDFSGVLKAKMAVDVEFGPRWSEKHNANCKDCDGRGFTAEAPIETLSRLLAENKFAELDLIPRVVCENCGGKGYDLKRYRAITEEPEYLATMAETFQAYDPANKKRELPPEEEKPKARAKKSVDELQPDFRFASTVVNGSAVRDLGGW